MKSLKLFFGLLILSFSNLYAQHTEITDSTFIYGIVSEDCYLGENISSYCSNGYDKSIEKGAIVYVRGVERCKKSYSSELADFYEVNFKNKKYFIEKKNVKILNDYTFDEISNLSQEQKTKFAEHSDIISKIIYYKDIQEALGFLEKCKPSGLVVYDWSFYDESEYTEGTSVSITVYNPTGKTIKYLWFSFVGYNPVGDKVIQKGINTITKKAVGPIEKDGTGSYEFDYVWFTDIVEKVKITSIKVQYMDGSIKTITNVDAIKLSKKYRDFLSE